MQKEVKIDQAIVDFYESLGFKYEVVMDSVYADKRDVPLYFFQTDHQNHMVNCSTLMLDDALRIYHKIHDTNVEIAFGRRCAKGHLVSLDARQCGRCVKEYNKSRKANNKA